MNINEQCEKYRKKHVVYLFDEFMLQYEYAIAWKQ